jgi:hypothetical protein
MAIPRVEADPGKGLNINARNWLDVNRSRRGVVTIFPVVTWLNPWGDIDRSIPVVMEISVTSPVVSPVVSPAISSTIITVSAIMAIPLVIALLGGVWLVTVKIAAGPSFPVCIGCPCKSCAGHESRNGQGFGKIFD